MDNNNLYQDIIFIKDKINTLNNEIRNIKNDIYDMKKDFISLTNIINKNLKFPKM